MTSASLTMDNVFALPSAGARERTESGSAEEPQLAVIGGLEGEIEAQVVAGALSQEGLFCHIQSHVETAHSRLFVPQRSWGSVIVRLDQAEQAIELINAVRSCAYTPDKDLPDELREESDE